jgi:hypothetical protein
MSRRSSSTGFSSLGLLLDTMCNAFGGVIFIAMLVAVLSRFAEVEAPADSTSPSMDQMRHTRDELASELRQMRTKLEAQQLVEEATREERARRQTLAKRLMEVRRNLEKLREKREQVANATQRARREIAVLEKAEKKLRARAEKLQGEIEKLEKEVVSLEEGERRKLSVRSVRETTKSTFWMIVKWQRFYTVMQPTGQMNTEDVEFTRQQDEVVCSARRNKGTSLTGDGWKNSTDVSDVLNHLSPDKHSLQFAVYPDSYEEFLEVRNFFRTKGYAWNWYPVKGADQDLGLGPGKATVQGGD